MGSSSFLAVWAAYSTWYVSGRLFCSEANKDMEGNNPVASIARCVRVREKKKDGYENTELLRAPAVCEEREEAELRKKGPS